MILARNKGGELYYYVKKEFRCARNISVHEIGSNFGHPAAFKLSAVKRINSISYISNF